MTSNDPWEEWAPYATQSLAEKGTIPRPVLRCGSRWVACGGSGKDGMDDVYRVVPLAEYAPPCAGLPVTYAEHLHLPNDHPARWSYEGVKAKLGKDWVVLTDRHIVPSHPYIPDPKCLQGECCYNDPALPDDFQRSLAASWAGDWMGMDEWRVRWYARYIDRGANPREWLTPEWRAVLGLHHWTPDPTWSPAGIVPVRQPLHIEARQGVLL